MQSAYSKSQKLPADPTRKTGRIIRCTEGFLSMERGGTEEKGEGKMGIPLQKKSYEKSNVTFFFVLPTALPTSLFQFKLVLGYCLFFLLPTAIAYAVHSNIQFNLMYKVAK